MMPLTVADFPLIAIGPHVYRRTMSSPILTAPSDALAADICVRLNREAMQAWVSPGNHWRVEDEENRDMATPLLGRRG